MTSGMSTSFGIKNHGIMATFNELAFLLNSIDIYRFLQKLLVEDR
jgi:hypothetical protein